MEARVVKKTMLSRNTAVMRWRKPSRESRREVRRGAGILLDPLSKGNPRSES
jgi:hypothetical protein